jgi:CysZ protein
VVGWVGGFLADRLDIPVSGVDRDGMAGLWDDVKAFFSSARFVIVAFVVKLALWFLFGLVGKYLVLIVLSPLLAYASERTEEILTGRTYPFRFGQLLKDAGRGILMALRNGFLELSINIGVWVLTFFIPILAPLSVVFLWLVSSWFYGFSMFDYVYERHKLGISASANAARQRRSVVLANGMVFNVLMDPPVVGWIWKPFFTVLGITFGPLLGSIGAVLAWHEAEKRSPRAT